METQQAAEDPAAVMTGLLEQLDRGDFDEEWFHRGVDEVIEHHGAAGIAAVVDAAARLQDGP